MNKYYQGIYINIHIINQPLMLIVLVDIGGSIKLLNFSDIYFIKKNKEKNNNVM